MIDQQLVDYIKRGLSQGYSREHIKSTLIREGWREEEIEEGFKRAEREDNFQTPSQSEKGSFGLTTVSELFRQSWDFYKKNFFKIIAIIGLPCALLVIITIILIGVRLPEFMGSEVSVGAPPSSLPLSLTIFAVIITIGYVILSVWATIALLYFIKDREESIGFVESYRRAFKKWFSYFWISILSSLVVLGGLVLLIIPGIIAAICVAFAAYVLVWEDKRGFSALSRSCQLVKGYWWRVLGRLLLVGLIPIVAGFIIALIIADENIKSVANLGVGVIVAPFTVYYAYLIYQSLFRVKGPAPSSLKKKWHITAFVIGIATVLLIPIILTYLVGQNLMGDRMMARDATRRVEINKARVALNLFHDINGKYPVSLEVLLEQKMIQSRSGLADPKTGEIYKYTPTNSQQDYQLCVYLEISKKEKCLNSTGSIELLSDFLN